MTDYYGNETYSLDGNIGIVSSPDWCKAPGWYDIFLLILDSSLSVLFFTKNIIKKQKK